VLLSLGELLVRNLLLPAKSDRKNEWKLALINGAGVSPTASSQPRASPRHLHACSERRLFEKKV
jgi:hypothetical protein